MKDIRSHGYGIILITCFIIVTSLYYSTGVDKNIHDSWMGLAPIGTRIEGYFAGFTFPLDACDKFPFQSLTPGFSKGIGVYSNKKTGRIVMISYSSYPCQGDGMDEHIYFFEPDGNALYYKNQTGPYSPTTITVYAGGIPVNTNSREGIKNKIKTTVDKVLKQAVEYLNIDEHIKDVEKEFQKNKNDNVLTELLKSLRKCKSDSEAKKIIPAGTWARPVKLKLADDQIEVIIIGENVRMRSEPNTGAKVLASLSYFDTNLRVTEIGKKETIQPWGEHHWYKVQKLDDEKTVEGWVFGAFVAPGIY